MKVFTNLIVISEVLVTQSCLTLFDPIDSSLPGPSVHGIPQARILGGLPFPSPGDLPNPGIEPRSAAFQAHSSPSAPPGKPYIIILYNKCIKFSHPASYSYICCMSIISQ